MMKSETTNAKHKKEEKKAKKEKSKKKKSKGDSSEGDSDAGGDPEKNKASDDEIDLEDEDLPGLVESIRAVEFIFTLPVQQGENYFQPSAEENDIFTSGRRSTHYRDRRTK